MNLVLALLGLLVLAVIAVRLGRLVACDGLGTNSPPRGHRAKVGPWADQELRR